MKTSISLVIVILMVLCGCMVNQDQKASTSTHSDIYDQKSSNDPSKKKQEPEIKAKTYDEKFVTIDSPTTKGDIPQDMEVDYGMIAERECSEKWETSLIRQYKALFMAMATLDYEAYRKYFYEYAIEYCQKHFEHLSTEQKMLDNFMEEMKPLENYITTMTSAHLNVNAVVPAFIRCVEYNNEMFVGFHTSINICTDKLYTHQKQCIPFLGISSDGGIHWSFMAYDETADIVLRSKFSNNVVDSIMGY